MKTSVDNRTALIDLNYENGIRHGLWGLWWTSFVARKGIAPAAAFPLAPKDEAEAQDFAKLVAPTAAQIKLCERIVAVATDEALAAFWVCWPLLQRAQDLIAIPDDLDRELDRAVGNVEWLGRTAAKAARILYLLCREAEGDQ